MALLLPTPSHAVDHYWDITTGDGIISVGSGTWDTSTTNWTTNSGSTNAAWTNSTTNRVLFSGSDAMTTYEITVTEDITTASMVLLNSGYVFNSATAKAITLSATTPDTFKVYGGKIATVGSNITLNISSNISLLSGATMYVSGDINMGTAQTLLGNGDAGTLYLQSGGTITNTSNLSIGDTSILNLQAGSTVNAGGSFIVAGSGSVIINGGDLTTAGSSGKILVGSNASNAAVITLNSGTITASSSATANGQLQYTGTSSTGTFNLNGGTLTVGYIMESGTGIVSTFNFNGGTLKALSGTTHGATFMAAIDNVNVRNGGAIIDTNGVNTTISSILAHSTIGGDNATDGGLQKIGTGTLTLTGANTYNGLTWVKVGTLATGATGTFGTGNIKLDSGTTLTIGNNTSIGDTATLTFDSASTINLNFTGAETLGNLELSGGSFITAGTYTAAQLNSFFGVSSFAGTGSLDVAALAIPEPSTYALLGIGILTLFGIHRTLRRRQFNLQRS